MEKEELKYSTFKDCFKQLRPECKQILNFRLKGMSCEEISEKLGICKNIVNEKMFSCRELLRNCSDKNSIFENP